MAKFYSVYEAKIPVTHHKGDSRAEWIVGVEKVGRTYTVYGFESAFNFLDDMIIEEIFRPYIALFEDMYAGFFKSRLVTRKSTWQNLGGTNTYLMGVKDEATALQMAKWLESVASNALKNIPTACLDRFNLLRHKNDMNIMKKIRWQPTTPKPPIKESINESV